MRRYLLPALILASLAAAPLPSAEAQVTRISAGMTSSPTLIPKQAYADVTHKLFFIGDPTTGSPVAIGFGYPLTTAGDLLFDNGGVPARLAAGTTGQVLTISGGGLPIWATPASGGTVTSFSAGNLSPLFTTSVATASTTPALTFSLTSGAANKLFATPDGASGVGSYRSLVTGDFPASGVTAATYGDSTHVGAFTVDATGRITSASSVAVSAGMTNPMTTLGDAMYGGSGGTATRLAGNTTSAKQFLTQTGTGSVSAAPAWGALVAGDIPSLDASKITTGTMATARLGSGSATSSTFLRGDNTWVSVAGGMTNPMTTTGDIIYSSDNSGTPARLGIGTNGQVMTTSSSGLPAWGPQLPWMPNPSLLTTSTGPTTWVNQGFASIANTTGGVFLSTTSIGGGALSLNCRVMAKPGSSFTVTMGFLMMEHGAQFPMGGLILRDSASGKLQSWHELGNNGGRATEVANYNSATAFGSPAVPFTESSAVWGTITWRRIRCDGSSYYFDVSNDGKNWLQMFSQAIGTFLTADQVGYFIASRNASYGCGMTIVYWATSASYSASDVITMNDVPVTVPRDRSDVGPGRNRFAIARNPVHPVHSGSRVVTLTNGSRSHGWTVGVRTGTPSRRI